MRLVFFQDAPPLAARIIPDNDKFQVGIILMDDRPQRRLKMSVITKRGSNNRYAGQRCGARL
jgi:hypothetical protein